MQTDKQESLKKQWLFEAIKKTVINSLKNLFLTAILSSKIYKRSNVSEVSGLLSEEGGGLFT